MENKAFLTVEEVAAEMGVSKSYAYVLLFLFQKGTCYKHKY